MGEITEASAKDGKRKRRGWKEMISLNDDFPEVPNEVIEAKALSLLEEFYLRPVINSDAPIPVERIAEQHLNYEIDVIEEDALLNPDILGGVVFDERIIQVSSSVTDHEGRYNFTIAHEIGHHVLHRKIYLATKEATTKPTMCRKKGQKPLAEKQADRFAAALLMPSDILANAIEESGLKNKLDRTTSVYDARQNTDQVRKSGNFSNVSNTALLNRMIDLRYITKLSYQSATDNFHHHNTRRLSYIRTLLKKFLSK